MPRPCARTVTWVTPARIGIDEACRPPRQLEPNRAPRPSRLNLYMTHPGCDGRSTCDVCFIGSCTTVALNLARRCGRGPGANWPGGIKALWACSEQVARAAEAEGSNQVFPAPPV